MSNPRPAFANALGLVAALAAATTAVVLTEMGAAAMSNACGAGCNAHSWASTVFMLFFALLGAIAALVVGDTFAHLVAALRSAPRPPPARILAFRNTALALMLGWLLFVGLAIFGGLEKHGGPLAPSVAAALLCLGPLAGLAMVALRHKPWRIAAGGSTL